MPDYKGMCERQEEQIAKLKCVCEVQKKKLCYLENGLKAEVKISDEVVERCDKENYIFNQIYCDISQAIRHSRQNKK